MPDPDPASAAFITMGDPGISRGDPVGGARDDALLNASINIL